MYARLAPRCGMQPVFGSAIGASDMHGGFSWSSLGHSISSGLSRLGHFASSAATRIGNSRAFQQAKSGFLQSGVLESAGQLAGQAVNSLVDIGRLKLESDLSKLRDRVVQEGALAPPVQAEHAAQVAAARLPHQQTLPAPLPPMAAPEPGPVLPAPAASSASTSPMPAVEEMSRPPPAKRRKRKRASGWGAALDHLLGTGVSCSTKRMCY